MNGKPAKRGFLGRPGRERRFNIGCLILLVLLAVLFSLVRMHFAPGDTRSAPRQR